MDKMNRSIVKAPTILPRCSCGYLFPNLNFNASILKEGQDLPPFDPSVCPACNGKITSIILKPNQIDVTVENANQIK